MNMPDGRGRIEAVVFDLDGTLADTMALAPQAYADTITCLGGPKVSPGEVAADWNIGSTRVVLKHFLGRPATSRDVDCFYAKFEAAMTGRAAFPRNFPDAPLAAPAGIPAGDLHSCHAAGRPPTYPVSWPRIRTPDSGTVTIEPELSEEALIIVVIRAVVFDIGGVLEITPDLDVHQLWETRLGLSAREMNERMGDVWTDGGLGTITLDDVHQAMKDRLDE